MDGFDFPQGATPLDADEIAALIPGHITLQSELNEYEQMNIVRAQSWLLRLHSTEISEPFLKTLHKKMFDQTWRWAGEYRKSNKNIGVDWHTIPIELKKLLDDLMYQLAQDHFSIEEIGIWFHHRLVAIHCFTNGNGRHARLACDHLLVINGHQKFHWGRGNLSSANEVRTRYLQALRAADRGNYGPLLEFARS